MRTTKGRAATIRGRLSEAQRRSREGSVGTRGPHVWASITKDEWQTLWESQGRECAICQQPLRNRYDPESTGAQAYTEHDHKLEKRVGLRLSVRGLACLWCNRHILVSLHDSADKAQRAADYLRRPPAWGVVDPEVSRCL